MRDFDPHIICAGAVEWRSDRCFFVLQQQHRIQIRVKQQSMTYVHPTHYVPGAASAHPSQQFVPSEPSPNGGSTTSSLRQFRKRDVDKSQLEQPPKQESHVARVAPHNHYPPVSNDLYRYPSHQFSDYSPQVKYSDITDASQPNPISTSVIQKPKPKDYMEMCNVQQQHINNQQQYSPDNGQYMHRDSTQGYPSGFKPETHYLPKDQHQYQQLAHHTSQSKFNPMMAQNMRKYNPGPADNPFLNKLSKIHPSMARSIISDHHMQDPQPSYSPIDQRGMYSQQSHRYYSNSLHQPNPYAPNPNYSMNPPHHYSSYPSASCSYPRTPTIAPRYSHMERSISPTRRGYPENVHMSHLPYHNMPQKMPAAHNYPPQYASGPEYAQHYQHRRMGQDCYPQPCRPNQYMQNHHQIPSQEMQELPENRISPSDSLKKFIENWAADEEPSNEINPMEGNMNLRDNIKVRDDAPPGTVYMINATDVQYFENNGIPIVTSDNGGIQLTSENYQYLLKNGLVDNSGMVRIIEANKEISIDSSGNHERVVNLQIMEASKPDCMLVNKTLRPSDSNVGPNGMLPKIEEENRRVVIHQNTVINPGNSMVNERILNQQPQSQAPLQDTVGESISNSKELVDKNCSPINLDQLEHNLGLSEPDPPETENNENQSSSVPVNTLNSNVDDCNKVSNFKPNDIGLSEDLSQNSEDNQNKSPGSKSMPIIDLFGDSHTGENETPLLHQSDSNGSTDNEKHDMVTDQNSGNSNDKSESFANETISCRESDENNTSDDQIVHGETEAKLEVKKELSEVCPDDLEKSLPPKNSSVGSKESTTLTNSVIVSPESIKKDGVPTLTVDKNYVEDTDSKHVSEQFDSCPALKKEDEIRTSFDPANSNKSILEKSLIHSDDKKTDLNENIDTENKSKFLDQTSAEIPLATIERKKRIFSVDDIIHHIGNNMKRGSKDLVVFCSTQSLNTFIEKEMEFSSVEQILIYSSTSSSAIIQDKEAISLDNIHIDKTMNSDNIVESTKSESYVDQTSNVEGINNSQNLVKENEKAVENEDPQIPLDDKSLNEESISDTKDIVNNERLESKIEEVEISPTEDSIQRSSDTPTVPYILDERSNTPSGFQYRNAIRVEESSVLLQIAGELMEISVNVVNGKKVITVVPLSETTVVDYNYNYEVSAIVQDTEAIQLDDSGIESEKTELVENMQDSKSNEIESNEKSSEKSAISENDEEPTSITNQEIINVLSYEQEEEKHEENNKNAESTPCADQNQPILDSKVYEFNIFQNDVKAQVQETDLILCEENKSCETTNSKLDQKPDDQKIESKLDLLEHKTTDDADLGNSATLDNAFEGEVLEMVPKITETENPEIIQSHEKSRTSIEVSDVIEVNNIESFVEEVIESHNTVEIDETPHTLEIESSSQTVQFLESTDPSTTAEVFEESDDAQKIEDLSSSSHDCVKVLNNVSDVVEQQEKDNPEYTDVSQNAPPDTNHFDLEDSEIQENVTNPSIKAENVVLVDGYGDTQEANENDMNAEDLDYQLEDDVFISEEPTHEIIVSDPLDGVGLIEEVDKTSDSFDIPLEPVSASDEIVETSELLFTKKLDNDKTDNNIIDLNENSIKETNILPESFSKEQEKIEPVLVGDKSKINLPAANISENVNRELVVRLSKPEVQILSPTSTNIDDHVAISKENVYLEPRRIFNTVDDVESSSIAIATKAAKKLYECDLQIPAVTTSGDINTKISKKSVKCQHDTVSSSKKERIVKDLTRTRKSTLKRSKRLNEKNQIKNEQKEMLRLLAEKRKQRKEAKQKEAVKEKEGSATEKNKDLQDNLEKLSEIKKTEGKHRHSTEHDDEYVDFKELLRARKLKKLKKMEEIKRREIKDIKTKKEVTNKISTKDVNHLVENKKPVIINKSVAVSSSYLQENKADTQAKCCVGCNNLAKKSDKDEKQKSKKRKSSEDKIIDDSSEVKQKKCKTKFTNSVSEAVDVKSNTAAASPVESKPLAIAAVNIKPDVSGDISNSAINVPVEIKSTEIQQITQVTDVNTEEKVVTPISNLEIATEKDCTSRKIKLQKRVSFCDEICSSTSYVEIYGTAANEDINSRKKGAHPSTPKDPRRRSKSYAGQVMVPSVSELIEENSGAVYKKKISLADYVSRKRKTSTENNCKTKSEENECINNTKFDSTINEREEVIKTLPSSYNLDEDHKGSKKTIKDVKTSFVIHSSDWEDSQSPIPTTVQSNEECLIQDFSGLIKSKSKRPVIDVNELIPLEHLENPKDKKLQEYKDKVDSQLSSLNIQIPKIKNPNSENQRQKLNFDPYGSPESSRLIKKFLSNEKITQSEMEKIKKIISYKRFIQHQKNSRSPSKSPASTSSTYSQSPVCSTNEPTCLVGKTVGSGSGCSGSLTDQTYEIKNPLSLEADSREMRLHLKKVNAKRKLHVEYDDESSSSVYSNQSESRNKKNVDYSVINRLGKDGLPKIIFKRNRQSNIGDDSQLVVELERIDNNLEMVEEKYNVTVTQMM